MKIVTWVLGGILALVLLPVLFVGGHACTWFGEAATVTREEFGPRALLEKYSRFKSLHASLAAKQAGIRSLGTKVERLRADYEGTPRKDWPRDDRQQLAQWESEIDGLKLIFNQGAATYNADMAKAHYRFTNVGDLPEGATEPLPREHVLYIVN